MGSCRLALSVLLLASVHSGGATPWFLVDVPLVVCSGGPGHEQIEIPLNVVKHAGRPHILSFFRSSGQEVTVNYTLTDSASPANTVDSRRVTLHSSSRRLEELSQVNRRLRGFISRRRSSSSSGFDRRRSTQFDRRRAPAAPATSATPARRRTPAAPATPAASSRRRTPAAPARPATAMASPTQTWSNSQSPGVDYRMPQGAFAHNYVSRPMSTGYGYSGSSNVGKSVALAAGAGLIAGVGSHYVYSRLRSLYQGTCYAGSKNFSNCAECRRQHSPASDCSTHYKPTGNVTRDDLMHTGFIPARLTGPLKLTITEVHGSAFSANVLCLSVSSSVNASNFSNTSNVSNVLSAGTVALAGNASIPDLFVTLTEMASLPIESGKSIAALESGGHSAMRFVAIPVVLACVGVLCCGCFMFMRRQKDDFVEYPHQGVPPAMQYPPPSHFAQHPVPYAQQGPPSHFAQHPGQYPPQ